MTLPLHSKVLPGSLIEAVDEPTLDARGGAARPQRASCRRSSSSG
ncbi:hypothetical protein [Streptomyces sp. NPDC055036]